MEITILCDQFDCTFNKRSKVHHDYDNDRCTHPHPAIQRCRINSNGTGAMITICNSKATKQWDNPLPPSCSTCETPDSDNCVNCCHKPKEVNITFPDGTTKSFRSGITPLEIAEMISPKLAREISKATVDNLSCSLKYRIYGDCNLKLIKDTITTKDLNDIDDNDE
jgi:hypothetical protein